MKPILLKSISLLLLATSFTASAEDIHRNRQRISENVRRKDPSSRELQFKVLRIRNGQEAALPINLRAGKVYSFISTCEDACRSLVLSLNDPYDIRVGLDNDFSYRSNAFSYQAERSGRYVIYVNMLYCADTQYGCEVGLSVHEGSRQVYRNFRN